MIDQLTARLDHAPKGLLTLAALALVFLIGIVDFLTGLELHLVFFYIFPIALTSWFAERRSAILIALFCSLMDFYVNYLAGMRQSLIFVTAWNLAMRIGLSSLIAYSLAELRSKLDQISEMANRDFLTGLPNGRAFYELAGGVMTRAFGLEPLTLACIDIEGFKWVNHRFGYSSGDQILCTIAHSIRECVPQPELVGRIGGTSFAVLLPNAAPDRARFILEKIHGRLRTDRKKYGQPVKFFISAIACSKAPRTIAELLYQAEARMSRMKHNRSDAVEIDIIDSARSLN